MKFAVKAIFYCWCVNAGICHLQLLFFLLAVERGHHSQWWSVAQYSPRAVGKEAGLKRKTGSHHHSTSSKEGKVSITEKNCIKENRWKERSKEIQGRVFHLFSTQTSCRERHLGEFSMWLKIVISVQAQANAEGRVLPNPCSMWKKWQEASDECFSLRQVVG